MSRRHRPPAVLLPPSEGKAEGGRGPAWAGDEGPFGAALGPWRRQVAEALAAAGGGDRTLLGVGGEHLERARSANATLLGAPTLPASERYTGVVWDHLDLPGLPTAARRRASASIAVVSGLHGAYGVDDPTPYYRLKMGANLSPLGKLSTWWRPRLSAALNDWLAGRVVVDLLPNEHRAAWTPTPDRCAAVVRVSFVDGRGKAVGHDAKAAKGLLARHLLVSKGDPRHAFDTWEHDRFSLQVDELTG